MVGITCSSARVAKVAAGTDTGKPCAIPAEGAAALIPAALDVASIPGGLTFAGLFPVPRSLVAPRTLLLIPNARVRGPRFGQLVRQHARVALLLAAVRLRRALVDRVPALHLLAVDVDVVVERV